MRRGQRNLITDVAGLYVGNAQDDRLKSGVTVLVGDEPFTASVAIQGGAPGTRDTELLDPDRVVDAVDALVLSGGSAFGLDAAAGVADALHRAGRGFAVGSARVPIVPAAILFDLLNGGDKDWPSNPYRDLGERALNGTRTDFVLGSVGAGCGALTGQLKGGLGSASVVLDSGHVVGALVAVNAHGSTTVPGRPHFWAAPFEVDREYGGLGNCPTAYPLAVPTSDKTGALGRPGNTTIAIVATDAVLDKARCRRLATAAHDGIARAIVPAHTPYDGDLVFAVATGARPLADPLADAALLGHAASLVLARAIGRAVYEATKAPGDTLPTWTERWKPKQGQMYP